MNKYIQQFLDDNDLQAGERFYILDKDYKKMFNKTFYINFISYFQNIGIKMIYCLS